MHRQFLYNFSMQQTQKFGIERILSILGLILRIGGIILIGISFWLISGIISAIKPEIKQIIEFSDLDKVIRSIEVVLNKLTVEGLPSLIMLCIAIGIFGIAHILAIIVLAFSSWKGQFAGKLILLISTIFFIVPLLPSVGFFLIILARKKNN